MGDGRLMMTAAVVVAVICVFERCGLGGYGLRNTE